MKPAQTANAPFFVDNEVIRLHKNGIWIADGHEITHEPTRRLFARSLFHDEEGYELRIGRETKRIEVEDTAYFTHRIDGDSETGFILWINDELKEKLDPTTLDYRPGRLTCKVMRHEKLEEVRFLHAPYFDLLKHLREDESHYFLEIQGTLTTLAKK